MSEQKLFADLDPGYSRKFFHVLRVAVHIFCNWSRILTRSLCHKKYNFFLGLVVFALALGIFAVLVVCFTIASTFGYSFFGLSFIQKLVLYLWSVGHASSF